MKPDDYVVMFVLAVGGGTKKNKHQTWKCERTSRNHVLAEESSPAYHASIIEDFIQEHLLFN